MNPCSACGHDNALDSVACAECGAAVGAEALRESGDWAGLAEHLLAVMEGDSAGASTAALELAEVYEVRLGEPERAATVFEWMLERLPGDSHALRELERLYGTLEHWGQLVETYQRRAAGTTDVFEQLASLEKQALVQGDAQGDEEAVRATCLEAMTLMPGCEWAWARLEVSHEADQSWWALVQSLTQVAMTAGAQSGVVTQRIAMVMDEHLEVTDKAIALYEASIESGGDGRTALEALEGLYAEAEDWAQLAHTYARIIPLEDHPETIAELHRKRAMVLADGVGDMAGAVAVYEGLLKDDPEDSEVVAAVEALRARMA